MRRKCSTTLGVGRTAEERHDDKTLRRDAFPPFPTPTYSLVVRSLWTPVNCRSVVPLDEKLHLVAVINHEDATYEYEDDVIRARAARPCPGDFASFGPDTLGVRVCSWACVCLDPSTHHTRTWLLLSMRRLSPCGQALPNQDPSPRETAYSTVQGNDEMTTAFGAHGRR